MPTQITVRQPAVAGQFYPASRETLARDLHDYMASEAEKVTAIGAIVPHAGYMYSGHVAGAVYARLEVPSRFVMLCPNHTGFGHPLSIMTQGAWKTPLGEVQIDEAMASSLLERCPNLTDDSLAHFAEHALEVQLPFLQATKHDFRFTPITVGTSNYEALITMGSAIANVISACGEPVMIIASSDMNHYETDSITRIKDSKAIACVLALDPKGLYETVRREQISMCGYAPAVVMLTAAARLGATYAELVKYATSGDISGERDMVVGYAGMIVR